MTDMLTPPARTAETPAPDLPHLERASSSTRLVGIDIARAFALIGMFTQHVFITNDAGDRSTGWVGWVFDESAGRASVLFFVLSGVSLAIVHRRGSLSADPAVLRRRGLLLLTGGILLTVTIWGASILQHYGVAFLLAPWLLRLGRRGLAAVTATGLIGGPIAMLWLHRLTDDVIELLPGRVGSWLLTQGWELGVNGIYPLVIWLGFFTLGILVGRTELTDRRTALKLVGLGLIVTLACGNAAKVLADNFGDPTLGVEEVTSFDDDGSFAGDDEATLVPGITVGDLDDKTDDELAAFFEAEQAAVDRKFEGDDVDSADADFFDEADFSVDEPARWQSLYDTTGHSGRIGWTLQTSGIAVSIMALALLLPHRLQRWLRPLSILGSMSLTAYLVHIVLVNDVWDAHVFEAEWSVLTQEFAFLGLVGVMTLSCVVFHRLWGAGPFERLLKHFTVQACDRPHPR